MSETSDPQSDPERVISLDELSKAFAQVMGGDVVPMEEAAPSEAPVSEEAVAEEAPGEPESAVEEDACPICPRSILEAMLFVGNRENEPLSSQRAAELMRDVEPAEILALVDDLNRQYRAGGCPYRIAGEGAGYRLVLRKEFDTVRNRFYGRIREARLSQAAIDVLAIIAYQQPLTADRVARMRGRPCSQVLSLLVRRGLLRIERTEDKQRTAQYHTTDRFLELFRLESLDDLPQSEELDRQ